MILPAPALFAILASIAAPALAIPIIAPPAAPARAGIPEQLSAAERVGYRAAFAAIRAQDWSSASAALDAMPDGMLTPYLRAELLLAKGSPKAELDTLLAVVAKAPQLPQAPELARLARARGALEVPTLPYASELARLPGAPKRGRAQSTARSDAACAALAAEMAPFVKEDRAAEAEALLASREYALNGDARTEWQQRVAWMYYLAGDDAAAQRVAARARVGTGEWAVQADWVGGLAAWRAKNYLAAVTAFEAVAARGRDSETTAAGLFWAARADMAGGRPDRVQPRLRTAARLPETFYGLLAAGMLGTSAKPNAPGPGFLAADWTALSSRPNIRVAAALVELGERARAETLLRHQARIGAPADHEALVRVAGRLALPGTQVWLAQNGPRGAQMSARTRYPTPAWVPAGGWRVDKSLIFAHALQESQFRTDAVSPAGARGLMQLMPGTAALVAKAKGVPVPTSLNLPETNIEYGQAYLERLRDMGLTGGMLPKVIAAYNAGPGAIPKWNIRDGGDPLLFIESIPYVETRGYVAIVLRNYWMYQQQAGDSSESLKAMAQGQWPRFPGTARTVHAAAGPGTASAD